MNSKKEKWLFQNRRYFVYLFRCLTYLQADFFPPERFQSKIITCYLICSSILLINNISNCSRIIKILSRVLHLKKQRGTRIIIKPFPFKLVQEVRTKLYVYKIKNVQLSYIMIINYIFLQGIKSNLWSRRVLHLLLNMLDNNFPIMRTLGINLLYQFFEKIEFHEIEPYTMIIFKILQCSFFWKKIKPIKRLLQILFSLIEKILRKSKGNEMVKVSLTNILNSYLLEIYELSSLQQNTKLIRFYSISLINYFFFEGPIICSRLGQVMFLMTILTRSKNLEILKIVLTLINTLISICWARIKKHLGGLLITIFYLLVTIKRNQTKRIRTIILEVKWILLTLNKLCKSEIKSFKYVLKKVPELASFTKIMLLE